MMPFSLWLRIFGVVNKLGARCADDLSVVSLQNEAVRKGLGNYLQPGERCKLMVWML